MSFFPPDDCELIPATDLKSVKMLPHADTFNMLIINDIEITGVTHGSVIEKKLIEAGIQPPSRPPKT